MVPLILHRLTYYVSIEPCAFCCQGIFETMLGKLLVGFSETARLRGHPGSK